jgi:hypothetical protein
MGVSFLGFSATIASVVISNPAIEAASCSAVRTTLVGSMMPSRRFLGGLPRPSPLRSMLFGNHFLSVLSHGLPPTFRTARSGPTLA